MKDNSYRFALLLAVALLIPTTASAQHGTQFGFDLSAAVPQGAFSQNSRQSGFGISMHGGTHLGRSPVMLGLDAGIHVYGSERRTEPLSTTIPDIEARVHTTNNMAQVHGMIRLQPIDGSVRPYVDALYGFKYLYTRTSLEGWDDQEVIGSTNFDDFTTSYGLGTGIDIRVWSGLMGEEQRPGAVFVSLGARYLLGGEGEYLREGDIVRGEGTYSFTTTRSRTDIVQPKLGVTISF